MLQPEQLVAKLASIARRAAAWVLEEKGEQSHHLRGTVQGERRLVGDASQKNAPAKRR